MEVSKGIFLSANGCKLHILISM